MNRRIEHPHITKRRKRIANAAARLIAENGIGDYTLAKRKATRSLGLPPGTPLPEDAEVVSELSVYQNLFQADEHFKRIDYLRRKSREVMANLRQFSPYLTGSVLDGTAGRHAEIDIQLFPASSKDVEIFLINQRIPFKHVMPRTERAEAVLCIEAEDLRVNLVVYPPNQERATFRTRNGRIRRRAHLNEMDKLIGASRNVDPL